MRKAIIAIVLVVLAFGSYGCNKIASNKVAKPDKEVEQTAKIMESQRKLADPNYVKHATPEQMKELSENLKK